MGAVCCVSGRDATTSEAANTEIMRRAIQYSPSWGIRLNNRGRVAGEDTADAVIVDRVRWNGRLVNKSEPFFEPSPEMPILEEDLEANLQMSTLPREIGGTQSKAHISGSPEDQIVSLQMTSIMEKMPAFGAQKVSALPDTPSSSYLSMSPLPSESHLDPVRSTPSKWSHLVPRSHLLRPGSDSLLCPKKPPSNYFSAEGTSPPTFSGLSVETTQQSHSQSIDGLSIQSFPESTASTHKKSWFFDSNSKNSHCFKLAQSPSSKSESHSNELKTCVLCSKTLNVFLTAVAVLECGHVYHADCLENVTPEISKYDPPCPVCTLGEKGAKKMKEKSLKQNERANSKMFEKLLINRMDDKPNNKKHRNHVINSDFISLAHGSTPRLESSSSMRSSLAIPFLKRHFSLNSSSKASSSSENFPVRNRSLLWSKSSK